MSVVTSSLEIYSKNRKMNISMHTPQFVMKYLGVCDRVCVCIEIRPANGLLKVKYKGFAAQVVYHFVRNYHNIFVHIYLCETESSLDIRTVFCLWISSTNKVAHGKYLMHLPVARNCQWETML